MNTEHRLRDLMAAYRQAAEYGEERTLPSHLADTEPVETEGLTSRGQGTHRRWIAWVAVASAAALVFVVAVRSKDLRSRLTTTEPAGAPTVNEPTAEGYLTAIRGQYRRVFDSGGGWWFTPPASNCRQAATNWTPAARQLCRQEDNAISQATKALRDLLGTLRPPQPLVPVHQQLLRSTANLHEAVLTQLTDDSRDDQQNFWSRLTAIDDAFGSLCQTVIQLNRDATPSLQPDISVCTG